MFWPILRIDGSSSSGFSSASASRDGNLHDAVVRRRSRSCPSWRVAERHVAGLARRDRQEKPTSSATHRDRWTVVSVSKAKRPAAQAFEIQASSCSRVVTVSYFERSNGALARARLAIGGARRRATRQPTRLPLWPFRRPGSATRPFVGTVEPTERSSGGRRLGAQPSAMRRVSVLNSISRRKPSSIGGIGIAHAERVGRRSCPARRP